MFDIDYILAPVDFSRSSRAALALARSLKSDPARLEVVHVVRPWPRYMQDVLFPYAPLGEDAPQIEHELLEAARQSLQKFHRLDGKDGVEPVVTPGEEKAVLPEYARSTAANLVVMGAFGEGGSRPDSLGSVSERMIRAAGAPVLLVRELDARPTLTKILVAVDLSEGSKRVLGTALGVAQAAGAELEIIHVVPDPLADDPGQVLAQSIKYEPRKVLGRGRDRIEALFDEGSFVELDELARQLTAPARQRRHEVAERRGGHATASSRSRTAPSRRVGSHGFASSYPRAVRSDRIVGSGVSHEHIGVRNGGQAAQQRQQITGRLLGGTACPFGKLREANGRHAVTADNTQSKRNAPPEMSQRHVPP